ncbi:MAG: MMPL family transporter [Byssovorax sp.]
MPRIVGLPPPGPEEAPPASTVSTAFAYRLADFQVRKPWIPLGISLVLTVVAVLFATRLKILMGFDALLPQNRPSVHELNRVAAKTAGVSTLFVVLQGGPTTKVESLRKAADALVPEIGKLGAPWVGSVEDGVHEALHFLAPRAGLFADQAKLEKLRDDVTARFDYEVAKKGGNLLDDSDPPPPIDPAKIKADFGLKDDTQNRYPDGYYQSQDGKVVIVAIRSKVLGSDFDQGTEALKRVKAVIEQVNPKSFDPEITYGFAGDLQTGISEYTAINADLTEVGVFGVLMITAVMFLYYLRVRTLFAMLITIGIGVSWTFGFTQLAIGHLNLATSFLFTIIAGNGINFGIIYMSRFLEARRRGATLQDGIRIAHRETWLPTLTAGAAAAASYGSLCVTEFRGFRDFGVIGSVGMVLCWIATYAALPSVLAVIERIFPMEKVVLTSDGAPSTRRPPGFLRRLRRFTKGGVAFGKPFAALVPKAPRLMLALGTSLAVAGFVATVFYVRADPMEYDLTRLRTDQSKRANEIHLTKISEDITGYVGSDGMAILVDRPDQVEPLRKELYARRDAAPEGKKPFKDVHSIQDFVPAAQTTKIPILLAIKDKIVRAHKFKAISEDDWKKLQDFLPPDDLKPFDMEGLPVGVARAFTEIDGTRGRIVYISPIAPEAVDDAHYLLRWADAYRETKLPDHSTIVGSGRAVIYADMWAAIISDVPPAVLFSFAATVLVVIIAFRAGRASVAVLAALLVGVGWMAGLLVLLNVKLQFLNFIALPITFGIGVDYAVNIVQRYTREGAGGALVAVRETGGAVILCSMTTTLGYLALVRSMNFAVRSLGIAAVLGEISCLLAAVLVLPAGLLLLDRNLPKGAQSTLSIRPGRPSSPSLY